jgi:hypothetical protein
VFDRFSFLAGYYEQLAAHGAPVGDVGWWRKGIRGWEEEDDAANMHLPLRARDALPPGRDRADRRRRAFRASVRGASIVAWRPAPTLGLLNILWHDADDTVAIRDRLRALRERGLVQVTNPDAPRTAWALQVPASIWDAIRGDDPRHFEALSVSTFEWSSVPLTESAP